MGGEAEGIAARWIHNIGRAEVRAGPCILRGRSDGTIEWTAVRRGAVPASRVEAQLRVG